MSKIIEIGITKKNNQKLKIEKVNNVDVVAGKGIKGDRNYHDFNEPRKQITLIESESIDYYNQKFNTNFSYFDLRRNLVTKDIRLNDLVGKKLSIGQVDMQVHDLCRPCNYLQEILGKDNIIKEFLNRGGVRCEILFSGNIKVGDEIKIL